jgi:hypothetical protein
VIECYRFGNRAGGFIKQASIVLLLGELILHATADVVPSLLCLDFGIRVLQRIAGGCHDR